MLNSCLVFQEVIRVVFIINGHVAKGLLHGLKSVYFSITLNYIITHLKKVVYMWLNLIKYRYMYYSISFWKL